MQESLIAIDRTGADLRARTARFLNERWVQTLIIVLIVLNAVTLGLETSPSIMAAHGALLHAIDSTLLAIFTVEIALRIFAFRARFFKDPWGLFDLIVVGISFAPASEGFSVLRALRILRVLRLVSAVPRLRLVVEAMLAALPGMGSIVVLMLLLYYVFAVMGAKLFGAVSPEKFGTLGDSLFTLFQLMTLEGWSTDIAKPIMAELPWAWLYFVVFILVATFVVLNLFIGVIVESIQQLREQREREAEAALEAHIEADISAARAESHADALALLREVKALRAEIAALRATPLRT